MKKILPTPSKNRQLLFLSTGFQIIYEGRLNLFKNLNIGILEDGLAYNECVDSFTLSATYDLDSSMTQISKVHHMRFSYFADFLPDVTNIITVTTNSLHEGMRVIIDDLCEEDKSNTMKENLYNQLSILVASDTTLKERKSIMMFIKGLDIFKYGELDHRKRFRSRCICFITCISIFLEEKLQADLYDTFESNIDRYLELLYDKLKYLTKETSPRKIDSPRVVLRVNSNGKDISKI